MKSYSSKICFCAIAAFDLVLTATFAACGDGSTTEVTESTGLDIIAKGDALPECGKDNAGDMIFVTDSAAVYYCVDEKWSTLKGEKGVQGDKGDQGEAGKATNGKKGNSCSATQDEKTNNVVITCETDDGKGVSYTIQNGEPGKNCSVKANEDGESYTISCEGSEDVVVENGAAGKSAYELAQLAGFKGSETEWLASLKGETGKSAYELAQLAGFKGTEAEWLASLKGETGKSAYELAQLAGFKGSETEWIASLKGEDCSAVQFTDESNKKSGYKLSCGGKDKGVIWNGIDGSSCSAKTVSDGIEVSCGGVVVGTLQNGAAGKSACALAMGKESCSDEDQRTWLASISQGVLRDSRDGQIYRTVTIGNQTWMAENLNYVFNVGTAKSWCYKDEADSCAKYGRLYSWSAAMDSTAVYSKNGQYCGYYASSSNNKCSVSGTVRGVCPSGWHLPSYDEWDELISTVATDELYAGSALKSISGWTDRDGLSSNNGKDTYGFTVLPAGYRTDDHGLYIQAGMYAGFWTATQYDGKEYESYGVDHNKDYNAYVVFVEYRYDPDYDNAYLSDDDKRTAYSVRCVKD